MIARSKADAAHAVAAVLDGARELAERHGVTLAIGASAPVGVASAEIGIASAGPAEDALDLAAIAVGALMGPEQARPKPGALKESIAWGQAHSAGLVREKTKGVA